MAELTLNVVTPAGKVYSGLARSVLVHTTEGDVCILSGHTPYAAALEIGRIKITDAQGEHLAACSGGFISVLNNTVNLVASAFEYAGDIDVERAHRAREKAEEMIRIKQSDQEVRMAEIKLKRALNRIKIAEKR